VGQYRLQPAKAGAVTRRHDDVEDRQRPAVACGRQACCQCGRLQPGQYEIAPNVENIIGV
jgi:hypothetical protein